MNDLESITAIIQDCAECPLAKGRTNAVPGDGNPDADIMFIGEGPGENEDKQGKPFVGAAGKLLEKMLGMIKLKREDVFIGNIVKCRPPNNRDPEPHEVKTCTDLYLEDQIKAINPKIICTLGRHAMNHFLPGLKISQVHGKPKRLVDHVTDKPKYVIYPMYHPAAALYHNALKDTLIQDFVRVLRVLDKLS